MINTMLLELPTHSYHFVLISAPEDVPTSHDGAATVTGLVSEFISSVQQDGRFLGPR